MRKLILGIDAAWTPSAASGIALLEWNNGHRRFICAHADNHGFDAELALEPAVIAIDMPIGRAPVRARRPADNAIARQFARHKAAVHSPLPHRPGDHGDRIVSSIVAKGYTIATADGAFPDRAFLEVFPLAALVRWLGVNERPKYKAGKSAQYWPDDTREVRRRHLLSEWQRIEAHLHAQIHDLPPLIPPDFLELPASQLKPFEDTLDAIICALLGASYLEQTLEALGDDDAAIWVPKADLVSSPNSRL